MTAVIRYRRRPEVLWRRSLDAVVMLPPGRDEPITIAGSGPEIWDLLGEWRTFEDLVAVLAELHAADPDTVADDLRPLLDDLVDAGAAARTAEASD